MITFQTSITLLYAMLYFQLTLNIVLPHNYIYLNVLFGYIPKSGQIHPLKLSVHRDYVTINLLTTYDK